VEVRPVDPRDTSWEIASPTFRVTFWERQPVPPDSHHPPGYRSTEFEINGADVSEVLAWAEAEAPSGSTHTIYALVQHGGERGLVRLAGLDPTAAEDA
jgi:hypothetical protein